MANWMYQNQAALSGFIVATFRVVWDLVEEKSVYFDSDALETLRAELKADF
jgi:hypothetical protein